MSVCDELCVWLPVCVSVLLVVALEVSDCEDVDVGEGENVADGEPDDERVVDCVNVCVDEDVVVCDGVSDNEALCVSEALCVGEGVGAPEGDTVWLPLSVWLRDKLCEGVAEGLGVEVGDKLWDCVGVRVAEAERDCV